MEQKTALIKQYNTIIESTLNMILDRYERHPDYGYLDTKYDLITDQDHFYSNEKTTFFRSGGMVYSWIQGRGLESLAGHCLAGYSSPERIKPILRTVSTNLRESRSQNQNRMFFMMDPSGKWVNPDGSRRLEPAAGDANYSDIFVSKGLLNAAAVLEDQTLLQESADWLEQIVKAIANHRFVTDQQPFDPANPVTAQPGKILQGPFMIALSGITRAAELTQDERWFDYGCAFIKRILNVHMKWENGRPDFFEAVHEDGTPWIENGKLLCDPGHTLEFLGLAQKFLFVLERAERSADRELIEHCRRIFPEMLAHTFRIGYSSSAHGIIKSFDILSQTPINSDMPWWSLPETIRAAAENEQFCGTGQDEIIRLCSEALWNDFTIPEKGYFAWQTRDDRGIPSTAIPAVPDLDPGYHTNLSLIDVISLWKKGDRA